MAPDRWQTIKNVLHAAWDRDDPAERAAFLDKACAGDAELRSQVESLLASDRNAGDFMAAPAAGLEPDAVAPSIPIGRYRLLREIGRGGMGTVYLAERADGEFRKRVAIKIVDPQLGAGPILQRFRAERQLLADLDHPNIARLLDGGATQDGLPYLVMEHVDGVSIDKWCDLRKLPVRDRVSLFRTVCAAVQYAHEQHVIHRDIKPANVLVTPDGAPKLLDFGIAKVLDPEQSSGVTAAGPAPMTPAYASPEQLRGEPVGAASDIYSLGVLLCHLLAGPRGLSGDLDSIVSKALRTEPEARYSSAAELSEDLSRFLQDLPVHARNESVLYRARKFVKRKRALIAAGVASALLVLAVASGLRYFGGGLATSVDAGVPSVAVLPFENLSGDPDQDYFADGMTDALIGELARIHGLRVISRTSIMTYKRPQRRLPEIARTLGVRTIAEGSVRRAGNRVRIDVRLVSAASDRPVWSSSYEGELASVLALQRQMAESISAEIDTTLTAPGHAASSRSRRIDLGAYDAYLKGRRQYFSEFSYESIQQAIASFHQALNLDPSYAPAYAGLADCYYMIANQYSPPIEVMPKAKWASQKAIELDDTLGEAHATLALVRSMFEFKRTEAEAGFKRALDLKPGDAQVHLWYGLHLAGGGRFDEAVAEVEQARKLDPISPGMNAYIGAALYLAHRYDEVIQRMQPLIELHPENASAHAFLALAFEQKGEWAKAIPEMERAYALWKEPQSLAQLGHIYAVSGRTADARKALQELLVLSRQRYVTVYDIALLHAGLGERDEAFRWLQKVDQDRSEWFAEINVDPRLDAFHSDPRFAAVLRSVGLGR